MNTDDFALAPRRTSQLRRILRVVGVPLALSLTTLVIATTPSPPTPDANTTVAWGLGYSGGLGDGVFYPNSPGGTAIPVLVSPLPGGRRIVSVVGGHQHSLAIADDGTLWAWGPGNDGQLGNGSTADSSTPVAVNSLPDGRKAVTIAAGTKNSMAVADDGTLWAWGHGEFGQLGNGSYGNSSTPVAANALPGLRKVAAVTAGAQHTLVLADDSTLWAWGHGVFGQLGNGTYANSSTPVAVNALPDGRKAVAVAAGILHCLALAEDGTMWAWGYGGVGQLGNGITVYDYQSSTPVQVNALPGGRKSVAIAAGWYHSMAMADDGTIWVWGFGSDGQLGNGTFTDSSTPVAVDPLPGGRQPVAVAAGDYSNFALANDGTVWAWGFGFYGELGDGVYRTSSPFGSSTPVQVIGLPPDKRVLSIGTGGHHTFALLSDANQPPIAKCKNVTVPAGPNCTANASIDDGSYDPDAGDTITISQSPPGPYPIGVTTVSLTVTDSRGASNSCIATVRVTYHFSGFLAPIGGADATGGSFASPLRTFKMGSTVPVKMTLSCGGSPVLNGIHSLAAVKYSDETTAGTPIDATPTDGATSGNHFRLTDSAAGQWHFNLDTQATGMSVGVWLLRTTLADGSQHSAWIQLK